MWKIRPPEGRFLCKVELEGVFQNGRSATCEASRRMCSPARILPSGLSKPFKHGIAITERMHMLIGASGLPERGVAELQARQVNWQGFSVDLPTGHNINQIFEAIDERCRYTKSHKYRQRLHKPCPYFFFTMHGFYRVQGWIELRF